MGQFFIINEFSFKHIHMFSVWIALFTVESVLVHYPREVGVISGKSLHLIFCDSDSMLRRQDLYLTTREKVSLEKKNTYIFTYILYSPN